MDTTTHYVISPRNETDPFARQPHTYRLPKRIYRWGVDGPWLLAWGSESVFEADVFKPVQRKSTFTHWFQGESAALEKF